MALDQIRLDATNETDTSKLPQYNERLEKAKTDAAKIIGDKRSQELFMLDADMNNSNTASNITLDFINKDKAQWLADARENASSESDKYVANGNPVHYANMIAEIDNLVEKIRSGKLIPVEKLQVYAASTDSEKIEILRSCGYKKEATMNKQLLVDRKKLDLILYSRVIS